MNAPASRARADNPEPAPAVSASVAVVTARETAPTNEFSGRLEAVERVEIRSRVSGAIQEVHFREGALVKQGDLLIRIDPALYAAEVARAEGQVAAARARVVMTKSDLERGQQLSDTRTITLRDLDTRTNAFREAEANLKAAEAALQTARLNLDYTDVRAPVSGRVGKIEYTVGNLIVAGPTAPVLTTLVSVNPIYASFNADEEVVTRALTALADEAGAGDIGSIPVEMTTNANAIQHKGRVQFIDNQVEARSGTVRVRAVFDNADGRLMPGQFARLAMGQPKTEKMLLDQRTRDRHRPEQEVRDGGRWRGQGRVSRGQPRRIGRRSARRHPGPQGRRADRRQRPAARQARRGHQARAGEDDVREATDREHTTAIIDVACPPRAGRLVQQDMPAKPPSAASGLFCLFLS